jgi:hypothetical protein
MVKIFTPEYFNRINQINKNNKKKSSVVYRRVRIGVITIGITWAKILPIVSVKTLELNSD